MDIVGVDFHIISSYHHQKTANVWLVYTSMVGACLACARPWVPPNPTLPKKKKKNEKNID
jgi:hypothetical protein